MQLSQFPLIVLSRLAELTFLALVMPASPKVFSRNDTRIARA